MKKLIQSTMLLTASSVVTKVLNLSFFVILARSLSVDNYGLFRYLIVISAMYAIAFSGIPMALTKYIGETKRNKDKSDYISSSTIMICAIFAVLCALVLILESYKLFVILFLFAAMVDALYLGFARGKLNYTKLAYYKLVANALQLAILVASYLMYGQVNFAFAVVFFSLSGIVSMIVFEMINHEFHFGFKLSKEKSRKIIQYSLPVSLGAIGWTLMFGINAIFIKHFLGTESVGIYSVAETVVQVFTFLPAAIATIVLPKVSGSKNKEAMLKPIKLAVLGSFIVSFLMLIGLILVKEWAVTLVFTEKYIYSASIIFPLALGQIFISIFQIYAAAWQGLGRPGVPSIIVAIGCSLNVLLSYLLVQKLGIMGAAISNAITSIVVMTIVMVWFYRIKWKTPSKQ